MKVVKLLCLLFTMSILLSAQDTLNNEAIVKMVKSGFGEALIVSMIQSQPGNYIVTLDAFSKLKQEGVSENVLKAMATKASLNSAGRGVASGATSNTSNNSEGDINNPLTSHDSGIYLFDNDVSGPKMTVLERAAYQGSKTGTIGLVLTGGIAKAKTKAIIAGEHASIRTSESSPVFYFYFDEKAAGLGKSYFGATNLTNPNQFALVKLDTNKSNRETIIMEANVFGASTGTNDKSMIGFRSERIRPGLYKVTLNSPLKPGEYCFIASAGGNGAMGAVDIFDFGVTSDR